MSPLYCHRHILPDGTVCNRCVYLGPKEVDGITYDIYQCWEGGAIAMMAQNGLGRDTRYAMLTVNDKDKRPEARFGIWAVLKGLAEIYEQNGPTMVRRIK